MILQLLLIELHGALYAVDSARVREIVPPQPTTRLPGAPEHIRGLMNLRGQLVTVLDLSLRITGHQVRNGEGSTIVVQLDERALGLAVDDVRDVQSLEVTGSEGLAHDQSVQGIVRGMGRLDEEVVLLIDLDELVRQTLA